MKEKPEGVVQYVWAGHAAESCNSCMGSVLSLSEHPRGHMIPNGMGDPSDPYL